MQSTPAPAPSGESRADRVYRYVGWAVLLAVFVGGIIYAYLK